MLLGSAALGALRVGDAPYPGPFITPIPPVVLRRPSGHNFSVSPGPIVVPGVFAGFLPQVPPQLNEPGVTMYFAVGQGPLTPTALRFTKPSGATYAPDPRLIYVGQPAVSFAGGIFSGNTYVVYTFAQNELDELGVWQVQLQQGSGYSAAGLFNVVRNVSN